MPNECYYEMKITGKKENVEAFVQIMQNDYNYNEGHVQEVKHLWRVFDADIFDEIEWSSGLYSAFVSDNCAWSVKSCMCNGEYTYQNDFGNDEGCKGTTCQDESKELDLVIEVFSEEHGFSFQEHFIWVRGIQWTEECVDYYEPYYDPEEFTPEEFIEEYNRLARESGNDEFPEYEELEPDRSYEIGGFIWEYCNHEELLKKVD